MVDVTLEAAGREARETLANLFQLYVHDFTEQWAGQPRGELQADGLFGAYPHLDSYWQEARRWPYLILADGNLAGFVLINDHSHSGLPIDYSVAEFFVVRKHRRGGVGRAAARAAIAPRPGQWELAVARTNPGALAFWQGVARSFSDEVEALDRADENWNGAILRFRVTDEAPKAVAPPAAPTLLEVEPQVYVTDLPRAFAYYTEQLGFTVAFRYGEPPFYGQVVRDGVRLNLRHLDAPLFDAELLAREPDLLAAQINVTHARALYAEYQARGVAFHQALARQPWHDAATASFIVRDPDGNLISFGGRTD